MALLGVFYGQWMQVELLAHFLQEGHVPIAHRHPDEAPGPADVVVYLGGRDFCDLFAIFVGDTFNQHGLPGFSCIGAAASLAVGRVPRLSGSSLACTGAAVDVRAGSVTYFGDLSAESSRGFRQVKWKFTMALRPETLLDAEKSFPWLHEHPLYVSKEGGEVPVRWSTDPLPPPAVHGREVVARR
jgi:hypothetical protein